MIPIIGYGQENSKLSMNYDEEAKDFSEALPIGNGRLGGMVYGGIENDRISLNEDTFWSGKPKDWNNPSAKNVLPLIRKAMRNSDNELADQLLRLLQGPYTQSYQPVGNVEIHNLHNKIDVGSYKRSLDLQNGVVKVSYRINGKNFERTYFASQDKQVIVINYKSEEKSAINFDVELTGVHQTKITKKGNNIISANGVAPSHVDPSYLQTENPVIYGETDKKAGLQYSTHLAVQQSGGNINSNKDRLEIKGADEVTVYISIRTNFKSFREAPDLSSNFNQISYQDVSSISNFLIQEILKNHIKDYRAYFDRFSLTVNSPVKEKLLREHRKDYETGKSKDLAMLTFHFGRYLMITGSRENTEALNLQGIWNESVRPGWSSNYTININTQMNYWPMLMVNLAEFNQPINKLIEGISINGRETAKINYNMKGWVAHHNADLWRQTGTTGERKGEPDWANYASSGMWLTFHLWDEYLYNRDLQFLKETCYPITKGAVEFLIDWLEQDSDGYYRPAYSVSTEASYMNSEGYKGWAAKNTTGDLALHKELLLNYIAMSELLEKDEYLLEAKNLLNHLEPYQLDGEGKIKEWLQDGFDRPKGANKHHLTHLIGVYPGKNMLVNGDATIQKGIKKTMDVFHPRNNDPNSNYSGWTLAWSLNVWARLKDSSETGYFIDRLMEKMSGNLFNQGNGFQIDGNMGYVSGICESLVQSYEIDKTGIPILEILPALPVGWDSGSMNGLRSKFGLEIDVKWKKRRVTSLVIRKVKGDNQNQKVIVKLKNRSNIEKIVDDKGIKVI
ncbi:glycoside hydrolase family 95 protein [Sphingobacterium cellulitidis]|uniref:glycoside hydrolase family 95 protein n=1 Tax=Sphingobacterium cellulitidis TaxID=1768011 RepID=UPI003C7CABDD